MVISAASGQVEEEDIASTIARYRAMLQEATKLLEALEFAGAIESYTRLVDAYKSGQMPTVTTDAREIVAEAWEGRALALANLGRNEEASADFEELIRFEPAHTIDLDGISSKIVALFTGAKKKLVGALRIDTDPLGAEILLDGVSLGPSPISDRDVLAGPHTLRIVREGYDAVEEPIQVEAGGRLERSLKLTPNARSIRVATLPREVKVLVDGVEKGTTFGRAGAEYEEVAREMGIAIADLSEPLLVPNLPPGEHTMVLRKDCYESVTVTLDVTVDPADNAPVAYKPFVLEPSRGSLRITSEPPGADVILDGKSRGKAPLTLEGLCSGPHDLALEAAGLGRYAGAVEVRKNQQVDIEKTLRLTIAAFDLRPGLPEAESIGGALGSLERYNVVRPGGGIPGDILQRVRLEMESARGRGLSAATLKDLFPSLKVELILIAQPAGAIAEKVEVLLYGPAQELPDRWTLEGSGGAPFRAVSAALERELPVRQPWSGIKLIDVRGEKHPIVLAVTPGSPAAVAGVAAGDALASFAGSPLARSADFEGALRKMSPGETATVSAEGPGGSRRLEIVLRETPVMLPMRDGTILYNKAIADLRQAAALAGEDAVAAGYSWLNLGVALMHFDQWEAAIRDGFRNSRLPDGAGISMGTVRYLTGLCYERLGLKAEARSAFSEAASHATATWESHDGPAIAPGAKRRAAALSG